MTAPNRTYQQVGQNGYAQVDELYTTGNVRGPGAPATFVEGDPNGAVNGTMGQLAIDRLTGNVYQNTDDAMAWAPFGGGGGSVGPGTVNAVAKFTAVNAVGDSQMTDDGANIIISAAGGVQVGAHGGGSLDMAAVGGGAVLLQTFGGGDINIVGTTGGGPGTGNIDMQAQDGAFALTTLQDVDVLSNTGSISLSADGGQVVMRSANGCRISHGGPADELSFHGVAAVAQQTVVGSRGGNAALADLLTKLANLGIIVDGTTP